MCLCSNKRNVTVYPHYNWSQRRVKLFNLLSQTIVDGAGFEPTTFLNCLLIFQKNFSSIFFISIEYTLAHTQLPSSYLQMHN